jgi:antitoxin (DNA-binding transcriptional repressor) of toxin-antitoxin stability system
MVKVSSIYEAKTHLSSLVKQAQAGATIYVGAYGQPQQAVIMPLPVKQPLKIGIWANPRSA